MSRNSKWFHLGKEGVLRRREKRRNFSRMKKGKKSRNNLNKRNNLKGKIKMSKRKNLNNHRINTSHSIERTRIGMMKKEKQEPPKVSILLEKRE